MALFKRSSGVYHYDFWFQRKRFQGSTHLKNIEKAKMFVSKLRTDLALGLVGLTHREPPPILSVFLNGLFLNWVRRECTKPRTIKFYEERVKVLCGYQPFTMLRLDRIDELAIQGYKDSRLVKKLSPATINGELRTLRKAMIYADRCDLVRYRKSRYSVPGEKNRTFILDGDLETRYLAACDYPLKQVAILMLDLGLRPEECVSLRTTDILDDSVAIRQGKTRNAVRALPLTDRARKCVAFLKALFPDSEWLFPGNKGGHFTRGAISNMHTAVRDANNFPAEFMLYSCRHTYASRLAEVSNGDTFLLMKALGHADPKMSARYVHPNADYLAVISKRKEMLDRMLRGEHSTSSPISENAVSHDHSSNK